MQALNRLFTFKPAEKVALRAAIAMILALAYVRAFHVEYGAWVLITTNIVLLVRPGESVLKGLERTAGHFLGFLIAVPLSVLVWHYYSMPYFWLPLLTFIAAFFFSLSYTLYSMFLTPLILLIYMSISPLGVEHYSPITFVYQRFIDIFIGGLIAIAASMVIFPGATDNAIKDMILKNYNFLYECLKNIRAIVADNKKVDWYGTTLKLHTMNKSIQAAFKALQFEPARFTKQYRDLRRLYSLQNNYFRDIAYLIKQVDELAQFSHLAPEISEKIMSWLNIVMSNFEFLLKSLNQRIEVKLIDLGQTETAYSDMLTLLTEKKITAHDMRFVSALVATIESLQQTNQKLFESVSRS